MMAASIKGNLFPSKEDFLTDEIKDTNNTISDVRTNQCKSFPQPQNKAIEKRTKKGLAHQSFESDQKNSFDKALKTAAGILGHADNTKKQLREKLQRKGYKKDVIDRTIAHLCENGYINECEYLCRMIDYYATTKLYGKRRIYIEVLRKGFDRKIIEENFEKCTVDVDFIENCAILIEKQVNHDRKKLVGSLRRYGYSIDEIREALRINEEYNDQ